MDPGTEVEIKVSQGPAPDTYQCNISIEAPSSYDEGQDYVGGDVSVTLVTDDGTVLLDTVTSSFPQAANYYGLSSAEGTLTMTYNVTVGGSTETDEDGNEVTVPGTTESRTFSKRITFTKE